MKQSTQYVDGLGRPLQTVSRQATPGEDPKDIVMPVIYDNLGREVFKYLPYGKSNDGNYNDGSFKLNPFAEQEVFYKSVFKDAGNNLMYDGEQVLYSKTEYESSPLNRVTKAMAAGNSWAGSSKGTVQQYLLNNANDAVRIWNIANTSLNYNALNQDADINIPESLSTGIYSEAQLFKNISIDEQSNAVVEYKDKAGRVILKKVQIGSVPADYSGYQNWLCTFYVYDGLGRLRFVIPPKAVEAIKNDWSLSSHPDIINELCFRYEYDERQRMIAKKIPGAGWVYMVYDLRNRPVYSQDANMRIKNQWMGILYDLLNRPVTNGILSCSLGREALQTYLNGMLSFNGETINVSGASSSSTILDMNITSRSNGQLLYQASQSITFGTGFESEPGAQFTAEIIPASSGTPFTNTISVSTNPIPAGYNFIALTITHYDDYQDASKSYTNSYNSKLDVALDNAVYPDDIPLIASQQTTGMVTWSKVQVRD